MAAHTPSTLLGVPYPHPTSPAVTAQMRGNKRADTKPEIAIRSALHRRGYRFRKDYGITVGGVRMRPDIVFSNQRIAVFVDGCFWHCCPEHGNTPRSNVSYWTEKLRRNVDRDRRTDAALCASGWNVIRVWEHIPAEEAATTIASSLSCRRSRTRTPCAGTRSRSR